MQCDSGIHSKTKSEKKKKIVSKETNDKEITISKILSKYNKNVMLAAGDFGFQDINFLPTNY